jgi:GT2 family glycosyltransferase
VALGCDLGDGATPFAGLTVVIPVRNQPAELAVCLEALLRAGVSPDAILVVDDASTDGTAAAADARGVRVLRRPQRGGPAAARNSGIAAAGAADIIVFVDADVAVAPDAIGRLAAAFDDPTVAAVFGSYDAAPAAETTVSRYRNLLHHFVHQAASPEASTFWAGCGAVRRAPLVELGGFDEAAAWHFIEDIELGRRLRRAGWRIRLDKGLQAKHLKRWTLASMVRTDLVYRARPWSRLLLQEGEMPDDLNLKRSQRLSVALSGLGCVGLALAPLWPAVVLPAAAALLAVVPLNAGLFRFLGRTGGIGFAAACLPLHVLHHLCAGGGFVWAWLEHRLGRPWQVQSKGDLRNPTAPGRPTTSGGDVEQ